eukprot:9907983-Alexandrium_andersonii.AAC.1
MSASLVGSEMCIRDRPRRPRGLRNAMQDCATSPRTRHSKGGARPVLNVHVPIISALPLCCMREGNGSQPLIPLLPLLCCIRGDIMPKGYQTPIDRQRPFTCPLGDATAA